MNELNINDVKDIHVAAARIAINVYKAIETKDLKSSLNILLLGSTILDAIKGAENYIPQLKDQTAEEKAEVEKAVRKVIELDDKYREAQIESLYLAALTLVEIFVQNKQNDNNN